VLAIHGMNQAPMAFMYENYLHPNRHLIFAGTYTDVTCYAQQRDAATVTVTEKKPDRIAFEVTDYLDDHYFDYPLTIKIALDDTWDRIAATQAGKPTDAKLVRRSGKTYAMVKAVPDRGPVVVTKTGDAKKYSSDATLAAIDYRTDLATVVTLGELPPRIPVPGFKPGTLEYTVTLPPGTDRVAYYAETAHPAATATRGPSTMGVIHNLVEKQKETVTITVTAEDETSKTYTVTFANEAFEPIASLAINTPANLEQLAMSQPVDFTVAAEPAGRYDVKSIQWYVNDEPQEAATGHTFRYTPVKHGVYKVAAKAGKVSSEVRPINLSKGTAPAPTVTLLAEDFSRHEAGKPVPTSDDPAANLFSDPAAYEKAGVMAAWKLRDEGLRIVEHPDRGKVAAWKTGDSRWTSGLVKDIPTPADAPLATAFKICVDTDEKLTVSESYFQLHLDRGGMLWSLMGQGGMATRPYGYRGNWNPSEPKWITFVSALDPTNLNPADGGGSVYEALFIGNPYGKEGVEFIPQTGKYAVNANAFGEGKTTGLTFKFTAGPKNFANLGKTATYLDDVRIYRIGSLVMKPAKESFAPDETVRMNFTHHINWATLNKERVKVTDSKGSAVEVAELGGDPLEFDYFTLKFPNGALKKGETYTVALDENVRDIIDKAAYDVATFKIK